MRHQTISNDNCEIAYGFDHACGLFFQKYIPEGDEDGEDLMIEDVDTKFDNLTIDGLMERLKENGVNPSSGFWQMVMGGI